jgi:hypothetical protein
MTEDRHPLDGVRPSGAPAGLRGETLRAARAALAGGSRDVWTRIARSRLLRLAWAAVVVALLGAHLLLSLPRRGVPLPAEVVPRLATGSDPAALDLVRMAAIDSSARPPSASRKENGS